MGTSAGSTPEKLALRLRLARGGLPEPLSFAAASLWVQGPGPEEGKQELQETESDGDQIPPLVSINGH